MARHESDREDLMREAVAISRRVELRLPGESEPVVAGFHKNGAWSVYFGGDPVYHFDATGRLRRAFVGGNLYRSQRTTLARLTRLRSATEMSLMRHDLSMQELTDFWSAAVPYLQRLADAVRDETAQVVQRIPDDWQFRDEFLVRLAQLLGQDLQLSSRLRK